MYHFSINNHLADNQYGFIPGKSRDDAVYEVVEWMKDTLRSQKFSLLVSLDISREFNCTWCLKILKQLAEKGCPMNIFKLI